MTLYKICLVTTRENNHVHEVTIAQGFKSIDEAKRYAANHMIENFTVYKYIK